MQKDKNQISLLPHTKSTQNGLRVKCKTPKAFREEAGKYSKYSKTSVQKELFKTLK